MSSVCDSCRFLHPQRSHILSLDFLKSESISHNKYAPMRNRASQSYLQEESFFRSNINIINKNCMRFIET